MEVQEGSAWNIPHWPQSYAVSQGDDNISEHGAVIAGPLRDKWDWKENSAEMWDPEDQEGRTH